MKNSNCAYCMQGGLVVKLSYLARVMDIGYLHIFEEQNKPGCVILAYKDHISEMVGISGGKRNAFFANVTKIARAVHKIYKPDKISYGAYGGTGYHLHMYIAPKCNDGDEWGGTFQMNPDKVYLTDDEYETMTRQIRVTPQGSGE